jgi:hypothetical protein
MLRLAHSGLLQLSFETKYDTVAPRTKRHTAIRTIIARKRKDGSTGYAARITKKKNCAGLGYVAYGLTARELERVIPVTAPPTAIQNRSEFAANDQPIQ